MTKFMILLAMMCAMVVPVMAQDKKEEPKKDETKTDVDAYALYKKKGRTWTWKISAKYSGYESVTYTKQEVTEVTDTKATIKMTSMDKDKKETYSSSYDVTFTTTTTDGTAKDAAPKAPEITEEKIKVEAGEYECQKITSEANGMKSTSWTSKKYPGLLVKSESKSDAGESTMELTEFKDA